MTQHFLEPKLRQRGRASINFLAQMGVASRPVSAQIDRDIEAQIADTETLPDDLDARHDFMRQTLAESDAFSAQQLMGDWHGRMHGRVAREAFEEIEPELRSSLSDAEKGSASLELDPDLKAPAYWDGVNFHRTTGGWEGHEEMGFIHGELIHRKMVDRLYPGGIFKQRRTVAGMAPRGSYTRILDIGCSSGHFTSALQDAYPDAQITGVDLSAQMLKHSYRMANANGWTWKLHQKAGEDTGFADGSFDLVTSYIVLHEMPADAIADLFAEAFRVLEPGGDMLMSDVTRYADLDKLSVWKADRSALTGGEPHWRSSASLDLAQVARDAGFVDVKAEGKYPHVVQGRKP